MLRYCIFLLATGLLFCTCQYTPSATTNVRLSTQNVAITTDFTITLLDSLAASQAIVRDEQEGFFEEIAPLDMAIQMKKNDWEAMNDRELLTTYKNYLQRDVSSFSTAEADFVQRAFILATNRLKKLRVNVLPKNINLIKTTAHHYGESTYYTREDAIVIPFNELSNSDLLQFTDIMLHEIFHIYSRNHPQQQLDLYRLIGFRPAPQLVIPDELKARILLNPDGVDYRVAIEINHEDSTQLAVPLLVSNTPTYRTDRTAFFEYLYFDLFPLQLRADSSYLVLTKNGWQSPIHYADFPDFYQQIRNNTDYIIHPDEILADNFVLLVNGLNGISSKRQLSAAGEELLEVMESVINSKIK